MLALLALVMILVLAVLEIGVSSTKQSSAVASISEVEDLERLPAQIIISQLQRATMHSTAPDGEPLTWASQPGMIRVFGTRLPKNMDRPPVQMHYRLYSAPAMNTPALDLATEAATMSQWAEQPAAFVDLNQPAINSHTTKPELAYPVADARALSHMDGYALRGAVPGVSDSHPLPMPAAWIYVLRDGRLVVPESGDGVRVKFAAGAVTKDSPVIGRIAFWTDDESCKLNLNTASEPRPWDMPAANTLTERGYALHVPATGEHFADSTHPAFTSLSVVMKHFGGGHTGNVQWPPPEPADPLDPNLSAWWDKYLQCYQSLIPHGAVLSGTTKQERHFASVDEFYFAPDRKRNGLGAGFAMSGRDLAQSNFVLTTHSGAPELNPFGQPKIALWMMPKDKAQRSEDDRRLNTCSALDADHPFMFQRAANWTGPTNQGSSQSMTADWSEVPRNRELYAWLQSQTDRPLPGVGASFASKYGTKSRDQILTSMLDMLRWSTNTASYLPPAPGAVNQPGLAEQSALPLVPVMDAKAEEGGTRGFGRFPTITEVALVLAFTDVERINGKPRDDNNDGICDRATKLRAFMVVNPCVVASGAPVSPAWSVRIRALQHFTIGPGIGLLLPGGNVRNRCALSSSLPLGGGSAWGGNTSPYACFISQFTQDNGTPKLIGNRTDPNRDFPFISSNDVSLPADLGRPGTTIKFKGGSIIVDLMDPDAPGGSGPQPNDAIHSVQMLFPETQEISGKDMELPVPSLRVEDFKDGPRSLDDRFKPLMVAGEWRLPVIQRGDIVRSMILNPDGPTHGDVRLLAARRTWLFNAAGEDTKVFVKHPDYAPPGMPIEQTRPIAQSLRDGRYAATGQYGAPDVQATSETAGLLLPGIKFASNATPAVPLGLKGAKQIAVGSDPGGRLGDWESGPGVYEDGPLINRLSLQPGACLTREATTAAPASRPFSAVNFGALPSGLFGDAADATSRPWQTLLFCPNPAGRVSSASGRGRYDETAHDHFGFATPQDHLWLEFFWNPATGPWPMSANFASEGKVNMNYQVLPWTWLRRATAMHGALQGVRMAAISTNSLTSETGSAKGGGAGAPQAQEFRYAVDADKTLAAFDRRFAANDIFRTPSEICEMFLVPKRISGHDYGDASDPEKFNANDMTAWWQDFAATGDNLREAPYAQLCSRLCTQSNVYRVHYRVQLLKKSRSTPPEEWDEDRDNVVAERRGSHVIERRLGQSPTADPATNAGAPSLHEQQTISIVAREVFHP